MRTVFLCEMSQRVVLITGYSVHSILLLCSAHRAGLHINTRIVSQQVPIVIS